jgi:hypothetical protein
MTLPQYRELAAYWERFPPIHLLLAKLVQYKGNDSRTKDVSDLMALFGQGGKIAAP